MRAFVPMSRKRCTILLRCAAVAAADVPPSPSTHGDGVKLRSQYWYLHESARASGARARERMPKRRQTHTIEVFVQLVSILIKYIRSLNIVSYTENKKKRVNGFFQEAINKIGLFVFEFWYAHYLNICNVRTFNVEDIELYKRKS